MDLLGLRAVRHTVWRRTSTHDTRNSWVGNVRPRNPRQMPFSLELISETPWSLRSIGFELREREREKFFSVTFFIYFLILFFYRLLYCLHFSKVPAGCWSRTDDCDTHAMRARRRLHRGARVSRLKRTGKLTVVYRKTGSGKIGGFPAGHVTSVSFFLPRARLLRRDRMTTTTTFVASCDVVSVSHFTFFCSFSVFQKNKITPLTERVIRTHCYCH